MLRRLSSWMRRTVRGWHALAALALFLIFGAAVLPAQARRAQDVSPDMSFFYSGTDLAQMAESYGEAGRLDYVRARWTFDLAFPLIYGLFLATSVAWSLGRGFPVGSRWQLANLVPLGAVVFDLLENTATSLVMRAYPRSLPLAAALAPWFTLIKWILVAGSFVLLLVGLAATLRRARQRPE